VCVALSLSLAQPHLLPLVHMHTPHSHHTTRTPQMLARVEICPETWRPVGFGQALVGWDDPAGAATQPPSLWVFEDWRLWEAPATPLGVTALGGAPPSSAALQPRSSALAVSAPRGVHFPMRVRHNATVGGAHDYYTTQVQLQATRISSVAYTIPLCTKLPVDASFDPYEPAGTWVRVGESVCG